MSEQAMEGIAHLVVGIDHVGYAVADLDAAIALHAKLGWRLSHREDNLEQSVSEAMLVAGDGSGAAIQLLAPITGADPSSPVAKFLARRGPGVQQVAYRVSDVAAATEALRRAGFRTAYPTARRGTADTLINFIPPADTGGVLIELVETASGAHSD